MEVIILNSQNVIDTLNQIIDSQDVSVASIARRMEKSTQALNKQLNNNDMKVSTMIEIIEALHCDVNITITDRATKKEYTIK